MVAAAVGYETQPYEVLITDDDEGCRETVREVLTRRGYRTVLASCGREAIRIVRRQVIHVAIVDMNMPDLTGLETMTIIRREVSVPVPGILVSADTADDLAVQARSADFESFLPKPLDLAVLRAVVREIINRYYEDED